MEQRRTNEAIFGPCWREKWGINYVDKCLYTHTHTFESHVSLVGQAMWHSTYQTCTPPEGTRVIN